MSNADTVVLGLDVGGTKTAAALMSGNGEVLGQGVGGPANINFVAQAKAEEGFKTAITDAQRMAGLPSLDCAIVIVGIEPDPAPLVPFTKELTNAPQVLHKKEGECSLVGGLVQDVGVSLIAGTGSVGWGRNAKGESHVTSCWGTIGDEGSAYDLARRGVNAAFWAEDRRGKPTRLVEAIAGQFGARRMIDIVSTIYQDPDARKNFASLSRVVMKVAEEGDEVAREVIEEGARQLAHIICTCAEVLDLHTGHYDVAATGGLVSRGGWYFDLVQAGIAARHDATLVQPKFEPVIGACLIGLRELGIERTPEVVSACEKSAPNTVPGA
jgi:N-acetylglucosamine kinase-like BadF-type ATPase